MAKLPIALLDLCLIPLMCLRQFAVDNPVKYIFFTDLVYVHAQRLIQLMNYMSFESSRPYIPSVGINRNSLVEWTSGNDSVWALSNVIFRTSASDQCRHQMSYDAIDMSVHRTEWGGDGAHALAPMKHTSCHSHRLIRKCGYYSSGPIWMHRALMTT